MTAADGVRKVCVGSRKGNASGTEAGTDAGPAAGLYVHVPFCASVCPYCDFAVTIAEEDRRRAWLGGVLREADLAGWGGPTFGTVYLGGGTPSNLASEVLARLLDGLRERLPVAADPRLYLEANPEDVTTSSAASWRELGFDVISLGLQSLDDRELGFLGRRHSGDDGLGALATLLEAGFPTVSADLIFGVPEQTVEGWLAQLETVVATGLQHLSCYQLTIHDGTVLGRRAARGELSEAPEEDQAELFLATRGRLRELGWDPYEVSNAAATPEHRSRHNQMYWSHAPYLGLGPGAHSFDGGRRRWWNRRKLRLWQADVGAGVAPVEGEERLGDDQLLLEAVMLGLRLADGVDLEALRRRFGLDLLQASGPVVAQLERDGLLVVADGRLRPTDRGLAVAEGLAVRLAP